MKAKGHLWCLIHTTQKNKNISVEEKERLLEILDMGTEDQTIIQEAIDILHKSGSIEYGFAKSKQML